MQTSADLVQNMATHDMRHIRLSPKGAMKLPVIIPEDTEAEVEAAAGSHLDRWRELMRDQFIKCHKNDFGKRDYKLDSDRSALSLHVSKIIKSNLGIAPTLSKPYLAK